MSDLVSVIVPVYNVAAYLTRCLNSILGQTYVNLEIILVDDGSTDGSGSLCDEHEKLDGRIKVIHQENGGLSMARNRGIDEAHGQYICFIDSDDIIEPRFVEVLHQSCLENDCDIAQCSFYAFSGDEMITRPDPADCSYNVMNNLAAVRHLTDQDYVEYVVAWNKLYHIKLFENIRYPEGRVHEDEGTTYKLFYISRKIAVTAEKMYGYFHREGSITKTKFSLKNFDYLVLTKERYLFFANVNSDLYLLFLKVYCFALISFYNRSRRELNDRRIEKNLLNEYRTTFRPLLRSRLVSPKEKLTLVLLYGVPRALPVLHQITQAIQRLRDQDGLL